MEFAIASAEILIVDAVGRLAEAMRAATADGAFRLRVAPDRAAAEAAAAAVLPDLILVFLADPHPSDPGFETCRRLREAVATSTVPLILAGSLAGADAIARGLDCGAADFVHAPFEPDLLLTRIRLHLAAARMREEFRREQVARLRAEDDARAAHRAKSDLLASMGHEIRTPMTAILGMSHLALQSGLNPKQRNYVEKVERSAELLLGTLNDILDLARIDAGTLELQHGPFELADLLGGLARLVGLKAEEKGLELLFEAPHELPPTLIGDGTRLLQVLVNLGQEAVRAGEQGEVVIGIEIVERDTRRATLRFSVRGAGGGARTLPAPAPQAAELGVAISRQLVRLMGSEITVSPPPAPGHVVHFKVGFGLPEAVPSVLPVDAPAGGARVLVVDDNATARRILLGMAAELGLHAESARDGWDALRMVSQAQRSGRPFELVLLDWKMPGMDGVECARHLGTGQAPPAILMITAFGEHDAMQRLSAQHVAVRGVLAKPVTPAALRGAVVAALRREPPAAPHPADRERALRSHAAQLRGARILLVEDNAIIQELALDLLTGAGMVVSVAENGREALARLAKQPFDGVLMDCQMPVMDGYEATRALRAQPHLKQLPMIALTANTLDGERDRMIAAGMNDHVAKPLDVDLMFETLARWVRPATASEPAGAAPVPPAAADDPLARLPGIDARVGRSSTMNNDKLYRRLLGMFFDAQRDFPAQFRAARSAGDDATAMRLAHNLRAVSASLGALAVQQSSGALERACADKAGDEIVDPLVERVDGDLAPVIAGLADLPR